MSNTEYRMMNVEVNARVMEEGISNTEQRTMNTHGNTFAQDHLRWMEKRLNAPGRPFEADVFVKAVREQYPERPELADAFARCTMEWPDSEFYTHFIHPREHAARWHYAGGFFLEHPTLGHLAVDTIHEPGSPSGIAIGGIEYLDRLFEQNTHLEDYDEEEVLIPGLAVVHTRASELPLLPDHVSAHLVVEVRNDGILEDQQAATEHQDARGRGKNTSTPKDEGRSLTAGCEEE